MKEGGEQVESSDKVYIMSLNKEALIISTDQMNYLAGIFAQTSALAQKY